MLWRPKIIVHVEERTGQILPDRSSLGLAYPNPFNAQTLIPIELVDSNASVELNVYDLLGRRVRTLFAGILPAGEHRYAWNGRSESGLDVGSGAYFGELRHGNNRQMRRVTLLK